MNSFLPGFNLIFVVFIYFLQIAVLASILIVLFFLQLDLTFWEAAGIYVLIALPILFSAKYLRHYYKKYKKTVS